MGKIAKRVSGKRAAKLVATAGLCVALSGCGDSSTPPRPAAEPADSPPTSVRPAGTVTTIGLMPEGIIFDRASGDIALGLREPDQLAFVNPRTLIIERQVPIPSPVRHLAISPDGKRVVVPAESANSVLEVSAKDGASAAIPTGEHPHDAASADGKIFAANEFGDTLSVIEGGKVTATLPAPEQPGGIAASQDRYVALIAVSERVLTVFDASTNEELGEVSGGVGPTHIETLGEFAYVADTEGDSIRTYLIGPKPEEIASVPAKGTPYGIAIDPRRKILWVTLTATNQLAGYRIGGPKPIRFSTYPTISQPNSVTVDPGTGDVFVASRENGQLERITPKAGAAK